MLGAEIPIAVLLRKPFKEIGSYAFNECAELKSVYVDSPLIGGFMFTRCTTLTSLTISKNVTTGNCVELPFYWLYCDTFITGVTADFISNVGIPLTLEQDPDSGFGHACDAVANGEYYLCWVGRSNNSHPIVREVKVMN